MDRNILNLDWGRFTPEYYNPNTNTMLHIFNHNIIDEANIIRTIDFCKGRIEWVKNYLELDCNHEVLFDDRGQAIDEIVRSKIAESLSSYKVKFMSESRA